VVWESKGGGKGQVERRELQRDGPWGVKLSRYPSVVSLAWLVHSIISYPTHLSLWATGEDTTYKQPPAHVSPSLGYGVIPPTWQYNVHVFFQKCARCVALWWGVAGGEIQVLP